MKKITLLLCLGLLGCATVAKESQTPPRIVQSPVKPMVSEIEMDSVISVFSEAINKDPNYAGAYYNRAIAYFYKKDYEKCWKDVYVAESLGYKFSDDFMGGLKKASRREK